MKNQYFNKWEFKKALSTYHTDPTECKNNFEEYLKKYPYDYNSYTYYAGVLIQLGEFDNAEKVLNYAINISKKDYNYSLKKLKLNILEENFFFCKVRLLSYTEKYDELYKFCEENQNFIKSLNLENVLFYSKVKSNLLLPKSKSIFSYSLRQMIDYQEDEFLEHIKKHLADYVEKVENPNKNLFSVGFPFKKIINETKKYIPSNKCLYPGIFENVYIFKYTNCGKDNNKSVDFFKVVCFHNTQNYITMLPCSNCENLPYIDLDYLVNSNDKPKVKTLSQIEKFNIRYNKK